MPGACGVSLVARPRLVQLAGKISAILQLLIYRVEGPAIDQTSVRPANYPVEDASW